MTIEPFHNAFLIHDDIQDESEHRRGAPTLQAQYGIGAALNVGNATNLLALDRHGRFHLQRATGLRHHA